MERCGVCGVAIDPRKATRLHKADSWLCKDCLDKAGGLLKAPLGSSIEDIINTIDKNHPGFAANLSLLHHQSGSFLTTTGFSFETHRIVSYLGIKSGEVVLGTGFLSDVSGLLNDMLGTTSNTLAAKFAQAKDVALSKLINMCIEVGANAVIGVDLDITTIGANMVVACANGTAVKVEPLD